MTDEQSLLRAVLLSPADDLPRLVLADWYDEHGQPERAEFIRVQLELGKRKAAHSGLGKINDLLVDIANTPPGRLSPGRAKCGCEHCGLRRREEELFGGPQPPARRWFSVPPGWWARLGTDADGPPPGGTAEAIVRRGFLAVVRGPLAALREHLPALTAVQPVERVEVSDRGTVRVPVGRLAEPWTFVVSDRPDRRNAIPWAVYERMPGEWYPTAPAALSALSPHHGRLVTLRHRQLVRQSPHVGRE